MFTFKRDYIWVFQNDYIIFHSNQQCRRVAVAQHLYWYLVFQSFNFSYSCAYKVIFFTINFKDNTCMLETFSCVCELLSYLLLWSVYSKVPLFFLTVFPCPLAKRHKFCNDKANFHYVPQEMLFSKVITMCKKWVFNLRCYKIMFNVKWFCCRCSVFKVIKDSVMYVSVLTEK